MPGLLATCALMIILSSVAVGLRFASRKLAGVGFWWEDWMCLAALVSRVLEIRVKGLTMEQSLNIATNAVTILGKPAYS